MKPSEVLKQYGWCQGAFARDCNDEQLENSTLPEAVCFCALGALYKCYPRFSPEVDSRKDALRELLEIDFIVDWNDAPERTKEEVIAAFEAIGE